MDQVKEAFTKVKQDILILQEELFFVKKEIGDLKSLILEMVEISKQALVERKKEQEATSEYLQNYPTHPENNPTFIEKIPTEKVAFKPLKAQNKGISIGNDGVPTDRQTNQQTNQQTDFTLKIPEKQTNQQTEQENITPDKRDTFKEAATMLESLDNLKKELRLKFKRLTDQELLVFSTLYQLEEENGYTDYKSLSVRLKLTESSIRDYIGKLIKKGIPVDKIKINNKSVHLGISPSLKKIASLPTILLLRDM
jgi:hypothetical protein